MPRAIVSGSVLFAGVLAFVGSGLAADLAAPPPRAAPVPFAVTETGLNVTFPIDDTIGNTAQRFVISRGDQVLQSGVQRTTIALRYAEFDPLLAAPPIPPELRPGADCGVFIVQFQTPPLEEYLAAIAALGGRAYAYMPWQAQLVALPADSAARVAALPFVRWVGPYAPAYRLDEQIVAETQRSRGRMPTRRYSILVYEREPEQKAALAKRIGELGGRVDFTDPAGCRMEATLSPDQLLQVVRRDEVMFVDLASEPENDMNVIRPLSGAAYLEGVAGFDGHGVRGEVLDDNIQTTHVAFAARPPILHGAQDGSSPHGTSTYGIVFGDGAGNAQGMGMLPAAQGIFGDYGRYVSRLVHTQELLSEPYRAVFQSNSWGHALTTTYGTYSFEIDDVAFRTDLAIAQSQSNFGDQRSRPEAWAKNVISVGGLSHYNDLDMSNDCWCGGASIGPASDGRIKPDLSHAYDSVFTVAYSDQFADRYDDFCCTSAATAVIGGNLGLVFEMWHAGIFGNLVGDDVFASRCHAATAKALLINSARQWSFDGPAHDRARMHQGWGLPDLRHLYDMRGQTLVIDESSILHPFETATFVINVLPGEAALKATMAYADPPGTSSARVHRVNDLTLRVTSPWGITYFGNNGLIDGMWSQPFGEPDALNTVENVFVDHPLAGPWFIEVIAVELNADARLETPERDADFALVVSGVAPYSCDGARRGDVNCDGAVDNGDIDAFVLLLTDLAAYEQAYPTCRIRCVADFNADGATNNADIDGFVACLLAGGCG